MTHKFIRLGLLIGLFVAPVALALSPEDLASFKSLPIAQQRALAKQFGANSPAEQPPRLEQPEVIEPLVVGEGESEGELSSYGYDLFAGSPTTFAPVTNVPVPSDYAMGPGDSIKVQEFGRDAESYEVLVDREGQITLPGVGQLNVIGMHYSEIKKSVVSRIEKQKIGVSVNVSMGNLRTIRIFVLGEARRPGSYSVSALTTMTNALFVSGGVKEIGSLRSIQLKRQGRVVAEMDLYDLLMRGDTSSDVRLNPGDVIFIPPIGDTIAVGGAVLRPAVYELKEEKTVVDALLLAGGLLPEAWREHATIERYDGSGERNLIDVSLRHTPRATLVQAGDKLVVKASLDQLDEVITVNGFAERVGRYATVPSLKITDIVPNADALKPGADLDFALLQHRNPKSGVITVEYLHPSLAFLKPESGHNKRLEAGDEVFFFAGNDDADSAIKEEEKEERRREDVFFEADSGEKPTGEAGSGSPEQKHTMGLNGKTELKRAAVGVRSQSNAEERQESTRSLTIQRLVGALIAQANKSDPAAIAKVTGAVRFPGRYPLDVNGTRVSDLLRAAGGLAESAYLLEAEVTRYVVSDEASGQEQHTQHLRVKLGRAISGEQGEDIVLRPRDVLTVRYVPSWDQQYEVKVLGEVRFPGTYPVKQGETLVDLVDRAGGLTVNAFPIGASLVRKQLKAKEQAQAQMLTKRLEADLASLSLQSFTGEGDKAQAFLAAQGLLDQLRNYEAAGRLVIDLSAMLAGRVSGVKLEGGDELVIPPVPSEVTVVGEVQFPTSHLFEGHLERNDYLSRSGGVTERADKKRIFVVKANGSVLSGKAAQRRIFGSNKEARMEPGDTVVVPLDADRIRPLTLWSSVTQIVYQLGLAAASFKAIGAF